MPFIKLLEEDKTVALDGTPGSPVFTNTTSGKSDVALIKQQVDKNKGTITWPEVYAIIKNFPNDNALTLHLNRAKEYAFVAKLEGIADWNPGVTPPVPVVGAKGPGDDGMGGR